MHRIRPHMRTIAEQSNVPGFAELTNLRICEEKQPIAFTQCCTRPRNGAEVETRDRAATDGVLLSDTNSSPYFKRTVSFRMVHNLFYVSLFVSPLSFEFMSYPPYL
ncbi:unnamed protein product, partial [Strongylus vulgaris]